MSSQVFDLTQPLIYNPAFVTAQGWLANAESALIAGIIGELTYFNIHTSNFPAVEIRGQLAPVPLPAALPLFAAGLGILTFLARRKKTKVVSATWRYFCGRVRSPARLADFAVGGTRVWPILPGAIAGPCQPLSVDSKGRT